MTPAQSGALMKRARQMLRVKALKSRDITVLDCMVWSCRAPGMRQTAVSLRRIAALTSMGKDCVIAAIARLERLGLLRKTKLRVRVRWGLGLASRQATNRYEFLPPATESAPATVIRGLEGVSCTKAESQPRPPSLLDKALERLRALQATT